MTIYADNAATTRLDPEAFEAMKPFLLDCYANPSQPYSFSRRAKQAIKEARSIIAECINAEPEQIIITSGGTESDNLAIKGILNHEKQSIVTSQIEHHAVLNSCAAVEMSGCPITYIPVQNDGIILVETLEEAINNKTKLVTIMFANNEIGTIQPIKKLAKTAHEYGAYFHTDAVQAVGHIPIDVKALDVDMLSASAHKFNGPKGIGFLYNKNCRLLPLHNGGTQEFGIRAGTENVAYITAMAVALKNNIKYINQQSDHIQKVSSVFLEGLKSLNVDYILNGCSDKKLPGNISISFRDKSGEALLHLLDLKGICVSTGSACDSIQTKISHVISAIQVPKEYAYGTIRISFGKDNTEQDALNIIKVLKNVFSI